MRARYIGVAIALLVVVGCNSDQKVTDKVKARLSAEPRAASVEVSTHDRIVVLTGTVNTAGDRDRIETMVHDFDGVLAIDDRIVVQQPVTTTGADDLKLDSADRSTRDALRTKLDAAKIEGISIDVRDGTVTLRGTVLTEQHEQVLAAARAVTPGHVVDMLVDH